MNDVSMEVENLMKKSFRLAWMPVFKRRAKSRAIAAQITSASDGWGAGFVFDLRVPRGSSRDLSGADIERQLTPDTRACRHAARALHTNTPPEVPSVVGGPQPKRVSPQV